MNKDQFERIERIDIVVHEESTTQFGDVTQDDPQPVDVYNRIVRLEETLKNAWGEHTEEVKFIFNLIDNDIDKLRTEVLQLKNSHLRVGSSVVIIKHRKIGVVQSVTKTHVTVKIDNEETVVKKRNSEVQKIG